MKKILMIAAIATFSIVASAQSAKLPSDTEELFNKADSTISAAPYHTPVIGVPFGMDQYRVCNDIVNSGAAPLVIPKGYTDINVYRDIAACLDGFVLPEDFTDSDSEALMLKAVTDRNLPVFGSCELLRQINARYGRMNESYPDLAAFLSRCSSYKKAKLIMSRVFSVDTHSDLPGGYRRKASVGTRARRDQSSIQKMNEGLLDAQVLVCYLGQGPLDAESKAKAFSKADGIIDQIEADIARNSDYCGLARTPEDALRLKAEGKKAFFMAVENAYALGGKLSSVKHFADRGAVYLTLSHMADNDVCTSSTDKNNPNPSVGLTEFGRKVVADCNRYGVIVDVSHTSDQTFWDVCKLSKTPFVLTHSGASAVYVHKRNVSDEMLKALAAKGGVIQIYMVDNYMTSDYKNANIHTAYAHLKHCIEVAGIDHVGIGADFDGGGGAPGWNGDNDVINLAVLMVEDGFTEEEIGKVMGGNFLRVLQQVQDYSRNYRK